MSTAAEINERFNRIPLVPEARLLSDERLFWVEVRVVLSHLREVNPMSANYLPFQPHGQHYMLSQWDVNMWDALLDTLEDEKGREANKGCDPTRCPCCGGRVSAKPSSWQKALPRSLTTGTSRRATLTSQNVNALPVDILKMREKPSTDVYALLTTPGGLQVALHRLFKLGSHAGATLSVSATVLRDTVRVIYPRAFRRYVRSPSTHDWLSYVRTRVGLVYATPCYPHMYNHIRLLLGPWPWPVETPGVARKDLDSWEPKDDAGRIADALVAARQQTARDGPKMRRNTEVRDASSASATAATTSSKVGGLWDLDARARLRLFVCCAEDDLERAHRDCQYLSAIMCGYYLTSDILVYFCNEVMAYLVTRAVHGYESNPWQVYPHILILVGVLCGAEDASTEGEVPFKLTLSSKHFSDGLLTELAAQLIQRHDVYRHCGFDSLRSTLSVKINAAVAEEKQKSFTTRFCSKWCPSFYDFVETHRDIYPGLLSFLS